MISSIPVIKYLLYAAAQASIMHMRGRARRQARRAQGARGAVARGRAGGGRAGGGRGYVEGGLRGGHVRRAVSIVGALRAQIFFCSCVHRRAQRSKYFFKLSLVRKAGHTDGGGRCFRLLDRRESSISASFS